MSATVDGRHVLAGKPGWFLEMGFDFGSLGQRISSLQHQGKTVVVIAAVLDRGPSIFASMVGVAVFAYLFVPDYYSFSLAHTEYAITLAVMLIVSILISRLSSRIRYQTRAASPAAMGEAKEVPEAEA